MSVRRRQAEARDHRARLADTKQRRQPDPVEAQLEQVAESSLAGRWRGRRGPVVRVVSVGSDDNGRMFVEYKYERSIGTSGLWGRVRIEPTQRMPVADFRRLFRPVEET